MERKGMDVAIPSPILSSVLKHLDSRIFEESSIKQYCALHAQLEELRSKLKLIKEVLEDVELMGILFPDFCRRWVYELLNVLYEADDLLDEARTLSRRAALPGKVDEKVRPTVSSLFFFRWMLPHELRTKINKNLHNIEQNYLRKYNLLTPPPPVITTGTNSSSSTTAASTTIENDGKQPVVRKGIMRYDPESQSGDDDEDLKGWMIERSSDRNEIKKLCFDENREIVWIVGSPGVGKTTLCRAVYTDKEVVDQFKIRLWVRLDGPDSYIKALNKIASKLVTMEQGEQPQQHYKEEKKPVVEGDDDDEDEEGRLIVKIKRLILDKRFLLVLDNYPPLPDIFPKKDDPERWTGVSDPFLPKLRRLFNEPTTSTKRSKIIITRLEGVMFGAQRAMLRHPNDTRYVVKSLSPEDGLSLFYRTAFGSNKRRPPQADWQRRLGKTIVSNCKRNPALIRCIGTFLQGKDDRAAWYDYVPEYRYPSEMYYHRIAEFYYSFRDSLHFIGLSTLLSGGGLFKYETLVSNVKANGLPTISKRMEKWFREVIFLERPTEDLWDEMPSCKLLPFLTLDLLDPPLHLGRAITRFQALYEPPQQEPSLPPQLPQLPHLPPPPPPPSLLPPSSPSQSPPLPSSLPLSQQSPSAPQSRPPRSSPPRSRTPSPTPNVGDVLPLSSLCKDSAHLRSFISLGKDSTIWMPESELDPFISSLRCVRVLDLSSMGIKVVPRSIRQLFHLRYLDLSRNDFRKLPGSICKLKNLHTLKLVYCDKLFKLPGGMGKLAQSLRIIWLDLSFHLNGMPPAISRLTELKSLDRFVVCRRKGGLRYLEKLNNLRGRLLLDLPRWWNDAAADARKADLERKHGIKELQVKWPDVGLQDDVIGDTLSLDDDHYNILTQLKPNMILDKLLVVNFRGIKFPTWITESHLTQITINKCKRCQAWPPFHEMPYLKILTLTSMDVEYAQHGCSNPTPFFPSLKKLRIGRMPNLKRWFGDWGSDLGMAKFPNLDVVEIWKCGNLQALPSFSCIHDLTLEDVHETMLNSINGERFAKVLIKSIQKLTSLPERFAGLVKEELNIEECSNLGTILDGQVITEGEHSKHFQLLKLKGFPNFKYLPEGLRHSYLRDLKQLEINGFRRLEALPEGLKYLSSLKMLAIVDCREMKYMSSTLKMLEGLEKLTISGCSEEVDCFDHNRDPEVPWSDLQQLYKLVIEGFEKLKSLPKGLGVLPLEELQIISCPELEIVSDAFRDLKFLWQLKLSNCEKVEFLHDTPGMQNETVWEHFGLAILEIEHLQNLDSLPDSLKLNRWLYKIILSNCKAMKNVPEWRAKDVSELSVLMIKSCPEFSKEIRQLINNYSFYGNFQQLSEATRKEEIPFYMDENLQIYYA